MTSQDKTFPNDIVQLSRSRAAFKGKLTQFTNFMDNLATPLSPDDILNLEFRIENVTSTYEKFDTIQMQLECLSEDTSSQLLEREKFEELYFESLAKAKGLVMAFRNDNDEPEAKPSHSSECIDSIKFPEIALPSFSGDFREWLEFRETFDALINQSSLKSIQKFKYLRSCLKDGALEVVNSIEYTSDGYQMAWRLLCERYNNPRLLVSNHLRSLFEIPSISSENAKSLRALIDNINKHLRSLHTLNIPIDDWDLIIIYFMSNKLPSSLQRSWEENQSSNVLPSLQDFKNFIRRRADILDNLNVTKPGGPEARKSLIYQSFWKGFSRDYVGLLQQRGKWQSSKGPTLAAGSVVLIKDKHTPPCQWRLARIIETHPGGDGVTRVATLRTSQGSNIKLSFPRICPLPILDNN
ncbi:uncharacterized protein LOC114352315 isoform X11 [Ostrinia furnacalis]|uniref:uncharacterized protein LOC114352315 isoform X11 n=1 Tax=Ostrinia furnacalis TaxID=93504 RepID=UPI00103E72BE|nr:uncharacterized protein LOC114352315 isoform X11 [Ostrinia furnacalis]